MASIAELLIQNTAGNLAPDKGPDIAGALKTGSEIALRREQAEAQRVELQQKQAQLQGMKLEKFVEAIQKGEKFEGKAQSNYFGKILPAYRDQLGLSEVFPDEALNFATTDPQNRGRLATLIADVQSGTMSAQDAIAAINDPIKFADVDPTFAQDILGAQKVFLGNEARQQSLQSQERRFSQGQETTQNQQFNTLVASLSDDVKSTFSKNNEKKESLRQTYEGLQKIKKQLESGVNTDQIEFNVVSRSLAKAYNSGALTEQDIGDFRSEQGIEGLTESGIRKWLIGGIKPKALTQLITIAERAAKSTDRETETLNKALSPRMSFSGFEGREGEIRSKSGIDAYLSPTLAPKGKKKTETGAGASATPPPQAAALPPDRIKALGDFVSKYGDEGLQKVSKQLGKSVEETRKLLGK